MQQPLFVLNAASVNRALGSADALLKSVDRPQLSFALRGVIAVSTNGLKGVDLKRPIGLMTFINTGDVPEPVGVVYVPLTGEAEFLASLKALEFSVKSAENLPGGYHVTANKQAFVLRVQGGYAFLARSLKSLDRDFGNPAARFADLSRDFDVSVRFQLDATPDGLKAMVLDYLRATWEMASEIRRGETPQRHKLRTAVGRAFLAGFEETVRDGRSVTLGLKVQESGLHLEARLVARHGSPLANGLNDLRADRRQAVAAGPKSAGFQLATNWKPPASLIPVFNAFAATMPRQGGAAAWKLLQRGLFATGVRLVAWSAAGTSPATLAVLSFPDAKSAALQVESALAALRDGGLVRAERVADDPKAAAKFQRLALPTGTAAGAVAVLKSTAWIGIGNGNVLTLLKREINAAAAPKAVEPLLKPGDLLHVSGTEKALSALFEGTWPGSDEPSVKAERFSLTVSRQADSLILRADVPPTAIRKATAPVLKRLLPR